ncbi:hypothetical protein OROMI_024116 [Orobanche minor]
MNMKFMKSLPEFFDEKISAVEEANDLDEISKEAIYGKFRAYELDKQQKKKRGEDQVIELKDKDSKKKIEKIMTESKSSEVDSKNENFEDSENDMKELFAMFAKTFRKGRFHKRKSFRKAPTKEDDKKSSKGVQSSDLTKQKSSASIVVNWDILLVSARSTGRTIIRENHSWLHRTGLIQLILKTILIMKI